MVEHPEEIPGVLAIFEKELVVHDDIEQFGVVRHEMMLLTVKHGELSRVEVMIDGYNDDHRPLYFVPEVRRWVLHLVSRWRDSLFWLTPGALRVFTASLLPELASGRRVGRRSMTIDVGALQALFAASVAAGIETLKSAGMRRVALDRAMERATLGFVEMLNQARMGDYIVVHPDMGEVVIYRSVRDSWMKGG